MPRTHPGYVGSRGGLPKPKTLDPRWKSPLGTHRVAGSTHTDLGERGRECYKGEVGRASLPTKRMVPSGAYEALEKTSHIENIPQEGEPRFMSEPTFAEPQPAAYRSSEYNATANTNGGARPSTGFRRPFLRRRKVCLFCADKTVTIDYKDPKLLLRFITERGKMVPSRITGVCAPHQRRLSKAIKQSRNIALLPHLVT